MKQQKKQKKTGPSPAAKAFYEISAKIDKLPYSSRRQIVCALHAFYRE